jgi:hypothetical protein
VNRLTVWLDESYYILPLRKTYERLTTSVSVLVETDRAGRVTVSRQIDEDGKDLCLLFMRDPKNEHEDRSYARKWGAVRISCEAGLVIVAMISEMVAL